jgi:hypothetical protein
MHSVDDLPPWSDPTAEPDVAARGLEAYGRSLTTSPVLVWRGKHTGSWWAFLDGRLIERPTALGIQQEIQATFGRVAPPTGVRAGEPAMTPHIPVRAQRRPDGNTDPARVPGRDAGEGAARQPRRAGHFFRSLFGGRPVVAG